MTEWLTDTEKRILLSAISREKKVCIQVDKESCREPYETSLESVCKSLEHKFMYDRLFKQIRAEAIEEFRNKLFGKLVRLTLSMWNFKLFDDILQETYKELQEQNK